MKTKVGVLSTVVTIFYLTSILGIGRYSCFCDHSSEISFAGISTECSCTLEKHEPDPGHYCPHCGSKLEIQTINRAECCSLKYFFLDTDQNTFTDSFKIFISSHAILIMAEVFFPLDYSVLRARIKTFQTLFYIDTGPLFIKFRQFII